jgi:8-oxo-dGTP pyrophosphatase MutT (NUDIX family)
VSHLAQPANSGCLDSFPYPDTEPDAYHEIAKDLYTLVYPAPDGPKSIGCMLAHVVRELQAVPESVRGAISVDDKARTVVAFHEGFNQQVYRTWCVGAVMDYWRKHRTFQVLDGWRDEPWPVYATNETMLYSVERSGAGLLGVMRYGVHMTAYVHDEASPHGIKIWVPRRAANKSTYPGMLDNSVAGGLMTGEDHFECMIREADEEAAIPEKLMRERCTLSGTVTYIYVTDERAGGTPTGLIYPETQWVYEIELPADVTPTPKDGEVAEFYLWDVPQIQAALSRGEFKPNCALVFLDFFVRKGILTKENEPDFDEIVRRMHRQVAIPGPHHLAQ